jgi:glutaredoxin
VSGPVFRMTESSNSLFSLVVMDCGCYTNWFPRVLDYLFWNQGVGQKIRRQVTLYTKPGCHLCDEAKDEIEASGSKEFDLVEINIAADADLYERYKYDIPVILIDGTEAFRHRLTAAEFLRALKQN